MALFAIIAMAVAVVLLAGCHDIVRSLGIEKPDYAKVTAARVTDEALITGISLKLTDCNVEDLYLEVPSDAPFTASIATDSNGAKIVFNLTSMPSSDYNGTIDVYKNGVSKKKASVNVTADMITPVVTMTLPSAKIDSTADIPLTLKNITFEELALEPISDTAKIRAELKNDGGAKIVVTNKVSANNDEVTQNIADKIEIKTKTGTKLAECTIGPDLLYDYRKYNVGGTDYKFQLVKMFHFTDGPKGTVTTNNGSQAWGYENMSSDNNGDIINNEHSVTFENKNGAAKPDKADVADRVRLVLRHDSSKNFINGNYDYVEIKFRSPSDQKTTIGCEGNSNSYYYYSGEKLGIGTTGALNTPSASDTTCPTTTIKDADSNWQTIGFWNSSGNKALVMENFIASEIDFTGSSNFSNNSNYAVVSVKTGSATEVDYIAFFKTVTADTYRTFTDKDGKAYSFELVKQEHFTGTGAPSGFGQGSGGANTTVNFGTDHLTVFAITQTNKGQNGNSLNIKNLPNYDYMEFKFKDLGDASITIRTNAKEWLYRDGKFRFRDEAGSNYNATQIQENDTNIISTTYNKDNNDYVVFGIWNGMTGSDAETSLLMECAGEFDKDKAQCHFVYDNSGTETFGSTVDFIVEPSGDTSNKDNNKVELDYISFYKKQ